MESQGEIWKSHPEYTEIEVSTLGRVRPVMGHYYTNHPIKNGYMNVRIPIDGKWTTKLVHRLVAQTFIPNPDNLPEINHKDSNRTNNSADNLEWCTHKENIAYRDKCGHTRFTVVSKWIAHIGVGIVRLIVVIIWFVTVIRVITIATSITTVTGVIVVAVVITTIVVIVSV